MARTWAQHYKDGDVAHFGEGGCVLFFSLFIFRGGKSEIMEDFTQDSGYGTAPSSAQLPGEEAEKDIFEFQGKELFVTYSRSRVDAVEEFHQRLLASLEDALPKVGKNGAKPVVSVYGSRELHEDGVPHYHVLLAFDRKVHWRNARKSLQVWADIDGKRQVDTESIYIRKRPRSESQRHFLDCVQAYIAKEGNTFGEWTHGEPSKGEKEKMWAQIVAEPSREAAEELIRKNFPRMYVMNHPSVQAFLREKAKGGMVTPYEPDFVRGPWKVPAKVLQWRSRNFPVEGGGRPQLLVLEGWPRSGKTEWALSFGRPVQMTGGWNMDEVTRRGFTHIVLNDINLKTFPYKREMVGCQRVVTVTGKWRPEKTITLGVPVIWTCNEDNSLVKDAEMKKYIEQSGKDVVYVKLRKGRKLYT